MGIDVDQVECHRHAAGIEQPEADRARIDQAHPAQTGFHQRQVMRPANLPRYPRPATRHRRIEQRLRPLRQDRLPRFEIRLGGVHAVRSDQTFVVVVVHDRRAPVDTCDRLGSDLLRRPRHVGVGQRRRRAVQRDLMRQIFARMSDFGLKTPRNEHSLEDQRGSVLSSTRISSILRRRTRDRAQNSAGSIAIPASAPAYVAARRMRSTTIVANVAESTGHRNISRQSSRGRIGT